MTKAELSVVVPCFNEEAVLEEFSGRMSRACSAVTSDYEIIFVDDGSSDRTWPIIETLSQNDRRIVGVQLFRNHGHQLAATAGLSIAAGDRVLLIDADLQDPPELLPSMARLMDEGYDVVYGKRIARAGETTFKRLTASVFYRLLNRLSSVAIPEDTGDFRLMSRPVVDILNGMPERHRFIRGMVSWIGGRQAAFPYARDARFAGETKYPLRKMISLAIDALTSFSTKPLRAAVWLGLMSSLFAFAILFYAVFQWSAVNVVPGWASSVVAISFFSGTQLFVMGVFGEYLGRVVQEVKGRPLFTIGKICRKDAMAEIPGDIQSLRKAVTEYPRSENRISR
ncbi:glucosyl transferase [Rhizobium wenxiniae]|uniref:Dolichol-phosphate mannosyltransferase n=1 Tax=Rhizobium wenxiniae TaxID=1737357 RepID=A0A7X0CYT0_9HYPH|nr:glycosyltransferase family 2 protein [Rhizobium wenxiniae]MBB6161635.1 dolichol-phosphate mannosyltransferase [Rhizobium wenxiniae]GGF90380.1 glucosyl transferase [Rhizobium wenxiniae]